MIVVLPMPGYPVRSTDSAMVIPSALRVVSR
jgi:hypothetical protein